MKKSNQARSISALELRTSAGSAPERRGSALLIVIGTLALVAVFAAVYVSIGRTDRRAANALRTRLDQRDTSVQAGEYLAGVIGDDRLDAYTSYDLNGDPFAVREVTDAPYTDWTRRSEADLGTASEEALLFTPTGRPFRMDGRTPLNDYRVANDPWLAATTPTFLGNPGDPQNGIDLRPFSRYEAFGDLAPNSKNYLDLRDWLQISNFAPDGRPVNLYNLRPNSSPVATSTVAQSTVGGFDAEPGIGTSPREDGRPIRRMSNYLSLLNVAEAANPQSFLQAFDPAVDGVWIPGYNQPQPFTDPATGFALTDVYNTPAVWTMYQRYMFMPMNQPFVVLNRNGFESSWADPDYPPYQYADADGDGFADSRWFELISARDLTAGQDNEARADIERLFERDGTRYFIAARAVDLSSMVNVNTAADGLVPPSIEYPMGTSPAEIDLRRLLTMQDAAGNYTSVLRSDGSTVNAAIPLSFAAIPRPYTTPDFAQPRRWDAPRTQSNLQRDERDYSFYQSTLMVATDLRQPEQNAPSYLIGAYAYDALRRARTLGNSLANRYQGYNLGPSDVVTERTDLVQYPAIIDNQQVPPRVTPQQRYDQFVEAGYQFSANPGLASISGQLFGLDDLGEMLTYHGLNDPDFTSRLERVMDGRYQSDNTDELQTRRMGPMLSNRDLTLDRFGHSRILGGDLTFDMRIAPSTEYQSDASRIGEISRNSMALMALTPRKRMTTLSGFVPISPDKRFSDFLGNTYDSSEPMPLDGTDLVQPLSELLSNPVSLFQAYSGALAGELGDMRGLNWTNDLTSRGDDRFSTLFYGHRGPELALRVAAHAAVNTADLADGDQTPTVATILLDNERRDELSDTGFFPQDADFSDPTIDWYRDFPGRAAGNLFDPGEDLIADNDLDVRRQAVNVYGMEAMPIISEVSTFYVYTDSSDTLMGDMDYFDIRPRQLPSGIIGPNPDPGERMPITIDGTRDYAANSDYLMQCVAFQIHNPWDVAISLGGDGIADGAPLTRLRDPDDANLVDTGSDAFQFGYYIEWNGYFFKLAEYERYYPPENNIDNRRVFDQNITGVDNPATMLPPNGGPLDPTTYPDFVARNVVLQPGETRVFYAVDDPSLDGAATLLSMDERWYDVLSAYNADMSEYDDVGGDVNMDGIPDNDLDEDGLPDGFDDRGWTGPAQEWLVGQLSPNGIEPVMIHTMNPQTGEYLDGSSIYDYLNAPGNVSGFDQVNGAMGRQDVDEVRLWLKIASRAEVENDTVDFPNASTENMLHNDLLVDRMDISATGLAEPMDESNELIPGTVGFPEDYPLTTQEINANYRNDNTGYSIVRWASTRRRDAFDAEYDSANYEIRSEEIAQVREWMMSSRLQPDSVLDLRDKLTTMPDIEDFRDIPFDPNLEIQYRTAYDAADQPDREVATSPIILFNMPAVIISQDLAPYEKDLLADSALSDLKFNTDWDTSSAIQGPWAHPDGTLLHDDDTIMSPTIERAYNPNELRPQLPSGKAINPTRPRMADLLLAWGIGPTYAPLDSLPDASGSNDLAEYYPEEWITFPEALAIATGFAVLNPTDAADSFWFDTWRPNSDREQRVLEEGRLALDRFVSYINNDPNEDPNEFTIGDDIPRGSGVPMAMGVLDRARALTTSLDDLRRPTDIGLTTDELGLTRANFGTININTAPLEVLRLLPGLSPSRNEFVSNAPMLEKEWWGAQYPDDPTTMLDTFVPDLTLATDADTLRENPDVAAAIVAYRDRVFGTPNTAAHASTIPGGNYFDFSGDRKSLFFSVNPLNLPSVANNYRLEDHIFNPSPPSDPFSTIERREFSGIEALRTTPGFGSVGELLAVRLDPDFSPQGASPDAERWNNLRHLSIDQLGYDGRRQGLVDQGATDSITIVPELYGNTQVGNTVDDYAERLAIANGVLNMISVRSDYYAVWFVVQGYRESDVANLRPEDPLIPSLHKRYMMVIDRSNVVEPGDKPKILMLKEVPL